ARHLERAGRLGGEHRHRHAAPPRRVGEPLAEVPRRPAHELRRPPPVRVRAREAVQQV
ncbi:MAG: hypothetical protein AVDCRST_MAG11-1659, partial [uncultured Gemmatimonadaceae bacterium]